MEVKVKDFIATDMLYSAAESIPLHTLTFFIGEFLPALYQAFKQTQSILWMDT
jgi:hypothetical protein